MTALRAALGSAGAFALVRLLSLPTGDSLPAGVALAGLAITLASVVARRPGEAEVARLADRRLGLRARLPTALEVVRTGTQGPIADRLVADAAACLAAVEPRRVLPYQLSRRDRLCLAGVAVLLAASLGLEYAPVADPLGQAGLPGGPASQADADSGRWEKADPLGAAARDRSESALAAGAMIRRAEAGELPTPATSEAIWQETALERVARALGGIAATRDVAAALRRGDQSAAGAALAALAEQLQRLSPQARQEMARALADSAADVGGQDQALARQLDAAARAFQGQDNQLARSALRDLADALARSSQSASDAASAAEPSESTRGAGGDATRAPGGDAGAAPTPGPGSGGSRGASAGGATERDAGLAGSAGTGQRVVDPLAGTPEPLADASRKALGVTGSAGAPAPRVVGVEQAAPTGTGPPDAGAAGQANLSASGAAGASQYVPWEARSLVRDYFSWNQPRAGEQNVEPQP